MSFIVTVNVNEGIVMASDSRISISNFETINDGSDGMPIVIKETMAHYADTFTEKHRANNGELPKYLLEGHHGAIIKPDEFPTF